MALLLYLILVVLGDFRSQIIIYLIIVAVLFAIYIFFVFLVLNNTNKIGLHLGWFILFALLARLILFPTQPLLSENVYPVLGGSLLSWKIILLMVEVALAFILLKLIKHFSLSEYRLVILICNPLIIIETYHSAHFDIIALTFFWLGILTFYKHRDRLALGAWISALLIKFVPIIMALPFLIKKLWRKLFFILIAYVAIIVTFILTHTIPMSDTFSDVNQPSFNGAIFKSITLILDIFNLPAGELGRLHLHTHTEIFYLDNEFYYKVLAAIVFVIIIFDQFRKLKSTADYRSINYIQASFIITGSFLLLTTTLYPWYVIVIIPFLIFIPNWSWLIFTFLIQLSYFVLQNYALYGVWKESTWVLLVEYIPFYLLLVFEYLDPRKIKGWFLE